MKMHERLISPIFLEIEVVALRVAPVEWDSESKVEYLNIHPSPNPGESSCVDSEAEREYKRNSFN